MYIRICRSFMANISLPITSEIVVFFIITFKIYHILVSKWKHGIGLIDIISFNAEL